MFIGGEVQLYLALLYVVMQIIGGRTFSIGHWLIEIYIHHIAIAGAAMVRLLISPSAYTHCKGGATFLGGELPMKFWQVICKNLVGDQ